MATVRFRLNHLKKAGHESKPKAILVEFYQNRTKVELSTGDKVLVEHWDGSRVSKAAKGFTVINKNLARIEMELLNLDRGARGEELKGLVRGIVKGEDQPDQKKNLIDSVHQFIAQYSREKEVGTVKRYKSLLSKLVEYGKPLSFETLDHNFYDGFKKFLYQTPNPLYVGHSLHRNDDLDCYEILPNTDGLVIGLFDDVVFKYFINLKTVCKWAEKRGHQVHEAHKSWEIIKRDYDPIYLTAEELDRVESIVFGFHNVTTEEEIKKLTTFWENKGYSKESIAKRIGEMVKQRIKAYDEARDFLVLECRTGQRISDLTRFSKSDIKDDIWTFKQKKGSRLNTKTISLPLVGYCAPALLILQKYNYELPKIAEQTLNRSIKEVGRVAGIDSNTEIFRYAGNKKVRISGPKYEFLSTHTGRKTFITLCLQDPGFTAKTVMDITGIKSFKTLSHYNGKSEIGNIRKALESMSSKTQLMKVV